MRLKRILRSVLSAADGVVVPAEHFSILDHPGRSTKEALHHFLDVAATPPRGGGEKAPASPLLVQADSIHSYVQDHLKIETLPGL